MSRFLVSMVQDDHFARWAAASEAERAAFFAGLAAFEAAVAKRGGTVVGGEGLDSPDTARTIRPGPAREVTAGPYAETVEQLGGFYVVEARDLDDAVEMARSLPDDVTVEVRPVVAS